MRLGEDGDPRQTLLDRASQRIKGVNVLDLLVKKLDTNRQFIRFGGEDVDQLAANPIGAAFEINIIAGVLKLSELPQNASLIDDFTAGEVHDHFEIGLGVAQAIYRRDGRDDQAVLTLKQRLGRREPHLLNMIVHLRVLLDVSIG